MAMQIKLQLKLSQQLVMTPQLQQAIKLLQLSRLELVDMVREEMLDNPVLEDALETEQEQSKERDALGAEADLASKIEQAGNTELPPETAPTSDKAAEVTTADQANREMDWENYLNSYSNGPTAPSFRPQGDDLPTLEATLTKRASLSEHLAWQMNLSQMSDDEKNIGMVILGNIDASGYFKDPSVQELASDMGVDADVAEKVLKQIQRFDPVGVAARSLPECLLIQAEHLGITDELVLTMIRQHLGNLEKKNYTAISRDCKEPVEEIYEAAKVIMELDPRPGRLYTTDEPRYITPDVYIHKVGGKYFVVPNDDGLPKLKISSFYKNALAGQSGAKEYIQDKLRSAQWLIRSIQQRQRTIIKATESIIKFQREFFDKGIAYLKPLILRDIAEDIGMHESTISRVTTNKYVHTPQGIYELKFFFNSGISRTDGDEVASQAVKNKIKILISAEDEKRPYSDQKIVELLLLQNIDIARRTVAKYREQLGILSSSKRKQLF